MKTLILERLNLFNEKSCKTSNPSRYKTNKEKLKSMKTDIAASGQMIDVDNISLYYPYMSEAELVLNAKYLTKIDVRFSKVIKELGLQQINGHFGDEINLYGVTVAHGKKVYEKLNFIQGNFLLKYSIFGVYDNLEPIDEYISKVREAMNFKKMAS